MLGSICHRTNMQKAVFLVLVAGDKAQCISLANWKEKRTMFLYHGSEYSKAISIAQPSEEITSDYISMQFFCTMACFHGGKLNEVVPFPSMFYVIPKILEEKEFACHFHYLENYISKTLADSIWMTERGVYNERTLSLIPNRQS